MKCTNCSHENNASAKFCENCGNPLQRNCPNCGQAVTPNAKFCANCGHNLANAAAPATERLSQLRQAAPAPLQKKILSTRAQTEGERKNVTVLFTDIVGSTALAEKLDPEEWGEIVNGAHQRVSDAVYRYEGTIAQLLGDGVLVFFGAPIAHEDDAERATRASLEILDSIGDYARELQAKGVGDFKMRVGLNTGLVVVGSIGSDMHVEYLAIGDTVNLAARMQSAAEPNTLLISANTARLVKHAFDLESLGNLELKGKSEPVAAFRVLSAKAVAESARGIEGLDSPLVGRERELQLLHSRIHELIEGAGHIVSIMGDAGLGKSRLVSEVVLRSRHNFDRLEGRCLSYTVATPYAPFVDLFTRMFDLRVEESDAAKFEKIGDAFIATMLGVKLSGEELEKVKYLEPPQLREKIFASVVALFETRAKQKPTALIFEDLHWADTNSLELLERLMSITERVPLMILAAFRPQRQEPSWRFHEAAGRNFAHRYTPITIEPLDEKQSRQLVANLLAIEDLPEKVRGLILAKAEGNPFFVEEVIRSLLDAKLVVRDNNHWRATREIVNISLPDTLAGVIQARLDRLDDDAKRAAQTSAVIGREFAYDVLNEIAGDSVGASAGKLDDSLSTLQRRELIREKSRLPHRAYLFKHVLTQEAAYNSLLLSKRREVHRKVAECLERVEVERASDIARHYIEAQEPARALPFLIASAEKAAHAYATTEALAQFTRALEIAKTTNQAAMARRAFEGLGGAQTFGGDPVAALQTYADMEAYAKTHKDVPMQISALNKTSLLQALFFAQLDEAEAKLNESAQLANACNDKAGLAEHYVMRCNLGVAKADFANLVGHLDMLVETGKELQSDQSMAFGLVHSANAWVYLAQFDKAWDTARVAMAFSRDKGVKHHLSEVLAFSMPLVYLSWGELDASMATAQEGARIAAEIGHAYAESLGNMVMGLIARLRGENEDALGFYQHTMRAGQVAGYPFLIGAGMSGMCATMMAIDPNSFETDAGKMYRQAQEILAGPMGLFCGGLMWSDLSECALAAGRLDEAQEFITKGLTVPNTMTNLMRPRLLMSAARLALLRGDSSAAQANLAQAREFIESHAMKFYLPELERVERIG